MPHKTLANVSGHAFVSKQALATIMQNLKENPHLLQEASSRGSVKRARDREVHVQTPIGSTCQQMICIDEQKRTHKLWYCDPKAFLWHMLETCQPFQEFLADRVAARPSSPSRPYRVALYTDEISPGNQLKQQNSRKTWGVYWSMVEWGPEAYTSEYGWFVVMLIRHDLAREIGMSQIMKNVVHLFDDFEIGVNLPRIRHVLCATPCLFVADEAAIKAYVQMLLKKRVFKLVNIYYILDFFLVRYIFLGLQASCRQASSRKEHLAAFAADFARTWSTTALVCTHTMRTWCRTLWTPWRNANCTHMKVWPASRFYLMYLHVCMLHICWQDYNIIYLHVSTFCGTLSKEFWSVFKHWNLPHACMHACCVQGLYRHLATQKRALTKAEFEKLEQCLGFNYRPDGILASPETARKLSVHAIQYDWMHCLVSSGTFHLESNLLMSNLRVPRGHENIYDFANRHVMPLGMQKKGLSHGFKKNEPYKGSASESLLAYMLIRSYLEDLNILEDPDHAVRKMAESFLALCKVLDVMVMGMRQCISWQEVNNRVSAHLRLFKAAHGAGAMVPKHHFSLHLSDCLRRHGILLSCFVHERRHKLVKRFANQLSNPHSGYEFSILKDACLSHIQHLEDEGRFLRNGVVATGPCVSIPASLEIFGAPLSNHFFLYYILLWWYLEIYIKHFCMHAAESWIFCFLYVDFQIILNNFVIFHCLYFMFLTFTYLCKIQIVYMEHACMHAAKILSKAQVLHLRIFIFI